MIENKFLRGNLIWSERKHLAAFVEDANGKFEIVNNEIVPILKNVIQVCAYCSSQSITEKNGWWTCKDCGATSCYAKNKEI